MMKLRGTLTEQWYFDQLSRSWHGLRDEPNALMNSLRRHFESVNSAFVLQWTPDQFEEIHEILVNGEAVVCLEISRQTGEEISFSVSSVKEYERQLSRSDKIQLAVALELSKKCLESKFLPIRRGI